MAGERRTMPVGLLTIVIVLLTGACAQDDIPLTHELALVPENVFHVYWGFNDEKIEFEIQAQTTGWVGFGISATGGMEHADVIIGWVKDGLTYVHDRYSIGHSVPTIDESQDWELLQGSENGTHTTLRVQRYRLRQNCDDQDLDITASTMRLIWAYHDTDPSTEELTYANYHGATYRGSRSIQLLNFQTSVPELPADAFYFDMINPNVSVPNDTTTYWCQGFQIPDMAEKHHVVMIEPIVQAGHEGLVHHIVAYACMGEVDPAEVDTGAVCFTASMPTLDECQSSTFAWAVGGGPYYFPAHAGYALGAGERPLYFRLETHYDNPMASHEYVDSSGLRIWVSPTLREYDSGTLTFGMSVSPEAQAIPPGQSLFLNEGWCTGACLSEALAENPSGVRLFASLLHTHVAGVALKVRHIRNGVELPVIDQDDQYDFNFQEARPLPEEVVVLPGDDILVECTYQTTGVEGVTWGGLATENEMCLAYFLYYPKIALGSCLSQPTLGAIASTVFGGSVTMNSDSEWVFLSPPIVAGYSVPLVLYYTDWDDPYYAEAMQKAVVGTEIFTMCFANDDDYYQSSFQIREPPAITTPLQEVSHCTAGCDVISGSMILLVNLVCAYWALV